MFVMALQINVQSMSMAAYMMDGCAQSIAPHHTTAQREHVRLHAQEALPGTHHNHHRVTCVCVYVATATLVTST